MKNCISTFLFLTVLALQSIAQPTGTPLVLTTDGQWKNEIIKFPLGFAPDIKFIGYEDIRFLQGWNNQESEEFWSYGFAWLVEEDPQISVATLEEKMNSYYDGLMNLNNDTSQKTISNFTKNTGSENTYSGTIKTIDAFFTKEALLLNVKVKTSYCEVLQKHVVLFHLSPQAFDAAVWQELAKIKVKCE